MKQTFDEIREHPKRSITKHALKDGWKSGKEVREELLRELGRKGILREQPKKHLFSRTRYKALNSRLNQQIQTNLKAVYAGTKKGDTEKLTLLGLVENTRDFKDIAGGDWRGKHGKRVKELCREDTIAKAILASMRDAESRQNAAVAVGAAPSVDAAGAAAGGGGC